MVDYELSSEPGGVAWLLVNNKELEVTVHCPKRRGEFGELDFVGWDDLSDEEQDDVYNFIDSEEFTKVFPNPD